jgi:hypothetical protein
MNATLAVYQANDFNDKFMTFLRRKSDIVSSGQKLLLKLFQTNAIMPEISIWLAAAKLARGRKLFPVWLTSGDFRAVR